MLKYDPLNLKGAAMSKVKFQMISNADKETEIIFETDNTIYNEAILEAAQKGAIKLNGNYTSVKIWIDSLVPKYGPYFYSVINENGNLSVSYSSQKSFDNNKQLFPGDILGFSEVEENYKNTPFYGFTNREWIKFFSIVDDFILSFRNYSREQIIEILKDGGRVHVDQLNIFNISPKFTFQISTKEDWELNKRQS